MSTCLYEDNYIEVLFIDRKSKSLLITFGDMMSRADGKSLYAGAVAEKLDVSILGFMPKEPTWYPEASMKKAMSFIFDLLKSYTIKVGYGNSMGGYAVIKYSRLLNLVRAVALDPQFSIDGNDILDNTYQHYYDRLLHGNMRISKADIESKCSYFVVTDPFYQPDVMHIANIKQVVNNLRILPIAFSYHSSVSILSNSNIMQYLLFGNVQLKEFNMKIRELKRTQGFHIPHLLKKILENRPSRFYFLLEYSKFDFSKIDKNSKNNIVRDIVLNNREKLYLLNKINNQVSVVENWLLSVHDEFLCYNIVTNRLETYPRKFLLENHSSVNSCIYPIQQKEGHLLLSSNKNYLIGFNGHSFFITHSNNSTNPNLIMQKSVTLGIYLSSRFGYATPMKDSSVQVGTKQLGRWEYFKSIEVEKTIDCNDWSEM